MPYEKRQGMPFSEIFLAKPRVVPILNRDKPLMAHRATPWSGLAQALTRLTPFVPQRPDPAGEAHLYYRRACLAASEERYDVALVFCGKALEVEPRHLPTRLLAAQIYDRGQHDGDRAIAAYRKVISLAGYDSEDPYCAAAQKALDALVQVRVALATPISA
jgi:tetratricopeptide (TPR) repeat protein